MFRNSIRHYVILLIGISALSDANAQPAQIRNIFWGSHLGTDAPNTIGHLNPSSIQHLYYFDDSDDSEKLLIDSGTGDSYTGDLIELGFFDTDGTIDGGSYSPNEDHTDMFKGVWTPLTSKTKIGRDWS